MAEFSEVMKQLVRMANACKGECEKCPLDNAVLCNGPWCFGNTESIAEAERIVMQWAAEHPEPVYPRWVDWLMEKGIIPDAHMVENSTEPGVRAGRFFVTIKAFEPIPADVAEKLGLEPKEG